MLLQPTQIYSERMEIVMGLPKETLEFIVANAGLLVDKRMLELGNQRIRGSVDSPCKTGKEFFTEAGCEHVSIDMNGKDGALKQDLSKSLRHFSLKNSFDIITNSGTSGYVVNQKACFENIDLCCKEGGLMIHIVPEIGSNWAGKQYDEEFFIRLAKEYLYEIVKNETMAGQYGLLRCVVLKKKIHEEDTLDS